MKNEDGKDRDFFTCTIQRSYNDRNGVWQNDQSFRRQDLLAMACLFEQAYEKLRTTKPGAGEEE